MKKYKIGKLFFVILLGVGSFLIYQGISLINAETLASEIIIDTSTSSLSVTSDTTVTTTNFPVCGLANGQIRTTMPSTTTDLCLYGMVLSLGGSGPWTWSCYANGTSVSCATASATTTTTSYYPVCGLANGQVRTTMPSTTADLCSYGTYSSLAGSGPWTWSCYANGTSVSCATATATTTTTTTTSSYPVCGLANGQVRTTMPSTTADLCSYGMYLSLQGTGPWTWSCYANGTSVSCATASTATTVSATTSEISYTTSTTIDTGTTLPTLTISATQIYDTIDTSIKYYKVTVLSNIASFLTKVKIRVFDDAGTQFSEVIISTPEAGSTGKTWTTTLAIPISATERVWTIKVIDYEYSSFSDTTYSYLNYTYSSGTNPITTITVPAQVIITPAQCYTDWSDCVGGIQTRELIYPLPSGCISTTTEALTRTCLVELETCSSYTFSDWSDCINNKRTRSILEQYPPNCILGSIILEESCQSVVEDTTEPIIQPETTPDPAIPNNPEPQDEPEASSDINSETTPIISPPVESNSPITPETNNTTINNAGTNNTTNTTTTNNITSGTTNATPTNNNPDNSLFETSPAPQAPSVEKECAVMGITSQGECQIYLYQSKIYQECLGLNLTSKNQCFQYFLSRYGKPIKCQGLSEAGCNLLINEIILADFKTAITEEVKNTLSNSVGATATINTQTQVLTINSTDPQSTKPIELNVQSLPLASSNGEVSVSLAPMSLSKNQEILAPVAIVFDENKNGIPDEIEIRSGITPENQEEIISQMTGVEKAIVQKEPLEQPKFNDSLETSETLLIESVENVNSQAENGSNKNNVRFKGKAKPNQVITLFIYSSMPIVLTVKTDENGNWVYDLNKDLIDGKHEVYVSINNDKGKITETSLAKLFFIEEAKAVSMDEFTNIQDATSVPDQVNMLLIFYILSGFIAILFFVAIFLIIKQRLTK